MGYLFGQKRRKVGRLQRQAARCFLVTQEASSVELGTWCWPRVVLIEKRPLTASERSSDESSCAVVWCATDPVGSSWCRPALLTSSLPTPRRRCSCGRYSARSHNLRRRAWSPSCERRASARSRQVAVAAVASPTP